MVDDDAAVAFLGETLGPLFLYDPTDGRVAALYAELAALDPAEAASAWPFGDAAAVEEAFALIACGLQAAERDALPEEYRRLFVGPARKAAPPWGSVYTDHDQVIFGASTLELRAWLRRSGIRAPGAGNEPEDHIGALLLLMAWVARNKPELLDSLLQEHLLTWAPHFLEVMQAATAHPFFEGLAALARTSLEGVQEARALTVEVPRFYR